MRLAIFDFDGTLADSVPWLLSILNDVADAHGFPQPTTEEVHLLRGLSPTQVSRRFGIPMWRVPAVGADVRRRMAADIDRIPLFDGVPEMLRALWDHNILLAIVSSNAEANVRAVVGEELAALIDAFECGVSWLGKAAKLRHVMSRCGVAAAHTLYVGDEIRDIEAARTAGVAAGAVTWGYNHTSALRKADPTVIFYGVGDILAYALHGTAK
ncbi:MAG: HAD hydrolase-like protein [Anaerolineae bacterium]|nr:HAD hydrolase-like protein [Anaerolineae bacterium]